MSASSSDSWILIALTIFVVLLLFYLSKKMICNSYGSTSGGSHTASPSSSSTSTSFSDYGRNTLEPDTFNPESDDLAIDTADSSNFHLWNWFDNRWGTRSCSNNNTNNLSLNTTVTSNGRYNQTMESSSEPSPENPVPISIIASPGLDRKAVLERRLRNQIGKIVQAEREIQRLAQLLAIEQGLDCQSYIAAARASLQRHHHEILSPSTVSTSSSFGAEATVASSTPTTLPSQHLPTSSSTSLTIPTATNGAHTTGSDSITIDVPDDGEDNHHHNNDTETTSPENRQHNESSSYISDFVPGSDSRQYPQQLSCGSRPTPAIPTSHRCRCNLCCSNRARMLIMGRLLPPLSFMQSPPIMVSPTTGVTDGGGGVERNDFLIRLPASYSVAFNQSEPTNLLTDRTRQHVPDPQVLCEPFSLYRRQLLEDNPPSYEECVRSPDYVHHPDQNSENSDKTGT